MKQATKVSFVMPTYNVEKYIREAIESIIKQTYLHWELIIVDDCSTDNTTSIIEEYLNRHSNITLIRRNINSGGCRLPRFDGIMASKGDFVCPIDSDDTIEEQYLEKLIKRQEETNADIVLNRMVFCNESLEPNGFTLPNKSFNMNCIISGKEACKETIGVWKIGVNGLIAKTTLYKDYIKKTYMSDYNGSFSDEIDHRKFLLCATYVSMTDAHYFYRQHPTSIIHTKSVKYYDVLIANKILLDFVTKTFKNDDDLLTIMYEDYFNKIYRSLQRYYTNNRIYNKTEKAHILRLIRDSYSVIKKNKLRFSTLRSRILSKSFLLLCFYTKIVITIVQRKQ